MFKKTAWDCWQEEKATKPIITLCKNFDNAIGGGIRIGAITSFVGGPGCGKTQLCLQLCINVQIPKHLYGLEGAAVFIETNRGFSVTRLKQIASATHNHCQYTYQSHNIAHDPDAFTVNTMLENVRLYRCNNYLELMATVYNLDELLTQHPKIKLIVVDSFSYPFRVVDEKEENRTQILYEILMELQKLAEKFKCAIVTTNELTTYFKDENDDPEIVPALGDSLAHRVNFQITLDRDENDPKLFQAFINKSFFCEDKIVRFWINEDGMRPIRAKRSRDENE